MVNWLDPSILLGTDTEAILSAVKPLDLNRVRIQKYAAYYLSKVTMGVIILSAYRLRIFYLILNY